MDEAVFDRVLAVNLKGAFLVAKYTIPQLRVTYGNLVFTGSTSRSPAPGAGRLLCFEGRDRRPGPSAR